MKIKLDQGAKMPTRAHDTDAGLDLYARDTKTIHPYGTRTPYHSGGFTALPNRAVFDTGVHIELPRGYYGKIESKSGLNVKHDIVSCGGVIDEGYTGSIAVKLYNLGMEHYTIHAGDKIAQLVIMPYAAPEMELVNELEDTERGDSGFGSTGR